MDPRTMVRVIAFINNKGGVGKTTQAFFAAKNFIRNGRKVVTVDFDQQGNISKMLPETTVNNVTAKELRDIKADYVIVDTAPTFNQHHVHLMTVSDLILVPFNLERLDIEQTQTLLETMQTLNVTHKARLILTHSGKQTKIYKALKPYIDELCEEFGVTIMGELRKTQAVSQATLEGKTVFEISSPPDVRKEFKEFFKELGKTISEIAPLGSDRSKNLKVANGQGVNECHAH